VQKKKRPALKNGKTTKRLIMIYLGAILCGIGLAFGQLLFKLCANSYKDAGTVFNSQVIIYFFSSVTFYGFITLLWIWLLSRAELGKLYPFMALAFAVVPIQSYFILGESFSVRYFIGIVLIMAGITLTVWQDKTWQ
jgi:drug/metabolite transporter (DMT)-like permease